MFYFFGGSSSSLLCIAQELFQSPVQDNVNHIPKEDDAETGEENNISHTVQKSEYGKYCYTYKKDNHSQILFE
jgi:hypothetical protein